VIDAQRRAFMREAAFSLQLGNEVECIARRDPARVACGNFEVQRHLVIVAPFVSVKSQPLI
jgi:hypothetical protein